MTQRDRWAKRPAVLRYWAFVEQIRLANVKLPECGAEVTFFIPMPRTWIKKKKELHYGTPHQQRPDLSNLIKALEDSIYGEDSHIWHYADLRKVWSDIGAIKIE